MLLKDNKVYPVDHLSFSQINAYLNICSERFRYHYVDREKFERISGGLVFGSAIHKGLTVFFQQIQRGEEPNMNAVIKAFEIAIDESFKGKIPVELGKYDSLEKFKKEGIGLLESYAKQYVPEKILAVAQSFEVLFDPYLPPLVGEFDLIVDLGDNSVGIVDFKTARARYSEIDIETNAQVGAYLWAIRRLGKEPAWFRFEILLKNSRYEIIKYETDRTEKALASFELMLRQAAEGVKMGLFYPRFDWHCQGCSFRDKCFTDHGIRWTKETENGAA